MLSKLRKITEKITESTFSIAEDAIFEKAKKFLNDKFGAVGTVNELKLSGGNAFARVLLRGESTPIDIEVSGLSYQVRDGRFILYFERILCAQKEWIQALFDILTEKTGNKIEFEDGLKLLPLKAILPKKE